MKAPTGNALLMNIIIVFLVVVLGLLVTSITYTKAFRVKNRIVEVIENYEGDFDNHEDQIRSDITTSLSNVGYRLKGTSTCKTLKDGTTPYKEGNDYYYCVYKYNTGRGFYYKVVTYMYLDLPVINEVLNIPVYGETKVFYE